MDAKVTLSFDADVISRAKDFADKQGISLSRLTEVLLRKATAAGTYTDIEGLPVAGWVQALSEGDAEYVRSPKQKDRKDEYFNSKK